MDKIIKMATIERYMEYLLAIFIVYANGSWLFFEYPNFVKISLYLFLLSYLFFQIKIKQNLAIPNGIVLFLALFPLFSKFFNLSFDLFNTISIMVLYLILGLYNKTTLLSILDKYAEVIYYLCLVSIVLGIMSLINYSWLLNFPLKKTELFGGSDVGGYYNLLIFTERLVNDFRTQSIFWEPGAWSFNELFSLYWFLFIKKNTKVLPFFLVGILLTSSTTGFMLVLLLFLQIFLFSKDRTMKRKLLLILSVLISLLSLISVYVSTVTDLNIGNMLYVQTIDKLFTHENNLAAGSANDRLDVTKEAFKIACANPIFGIGRQSAENIKYVTSSISELSYQLGFLYTFVFVYLFRIVFKKLNWLISIAFIIILLNGEAYSGYILCSLIVLCGAKMTRWAEFFSLKKTAITT